MNREFNSIISERISTIRKTYNLTIEQLAYKSGISKGGLSEIERCLKEPKISTVAKICAGLGIRMCDFFDFQDIDDYVDKL